VSIYDEIREVFQQRYEEAPTFVVRAPGRVNLIGEHTDYNDGFVLPMAIDRATWIALRPRADRHVNVHALNLDEYHEIDLDALQKAEIGPAEYIKGVAWALQEDGFTLKGWEGVIMGDVPVGSGLSSSAALEMATAQAFAAVSGFAWDAPRMAKLGQKAENQWVGVSTGIMDQMISAAGKQDHALLIDCRSLETDLVQLPPGTAVLVLDTGTRRGLVGGAYDERRSQCEEAARFFGVPALRDVDYAAFEEKGGGLDPIVWQRARHIITENERTLKACDAMRAGDAKTLGQLMNASHDSLRDDYEVSSDALNQIVDIARQHDAVYGARMTGAGFGGCAVALVAAERAEPFADYVLQHYTYDAQLPPQVYICHAAEGAEIMG
jgi:galactokinase